MKTMLLAVAMMVVGCAPEARAPLDGRSYQVVLSPERGGPPATIDLVFSRGTIDASDAHADGFVPAPYRTIDDEFVAETRGPSGVRRFKGQLAGKHVVGTITVIPHGGAPTVYVFAGETRG
jgi:hypothetical protein